MKIWKEKFLETLARTGSVSNACRTAGIAYVTAYRARHDPDPEFAKRWQAALFTFQEAHPYAKTPVNPEAKPRGGRLKAKAKAKAKAEAVAVAVAVIEDQKDPDDQDDDQELSVVDAVLELDPNSPATKDQLRKQLEEALHRGISLAKIARILSRIADGKICDEEYGASGLIRKKKSVTARMRAIELILEVQGLINSTAPAPAHQTGSTNILNLIGDPQRLSPKARKSLEGAIAKSIGATARRDSPDQ